MIRIQKYTDKDSKIWNDFNAASKNHLFMFDRNYMDYHRDRFQDFSMLVYSEDELVALFPACIQDNRLISHGGLTFGGFITNERMKQHTMNDCFNALIEYGRSFNWTSILYKVIPHVYHLQSAEEDRYSLFANGAKILTIDASTYINLSFPLKMSKGRKAQVSRAKREGVQIRELKDMDSFDEFIDLENEVLELRHGTRAVHTAKELKMLHDRFPNNIHLFGAIKRDNIIAGTVIYEYDNVIHTQYMAANEEARKIGALDLAVVSVIELYRDKKLWLDFGISTEHGRIYLNEGLINQKESFGGRTGVYEIWELDL